MESLISGAKARVTEILSESVGILTLHNENCDRVLFHIRDLYVNGKKCYPGKLLSNCISVGTFVNCDAVKVELHIPYLATFVCVGWSPDFDTVFSEFVVEKHKMPVPMFGYAYRGIVVKLLFPSTALAMVSIDEVLVPTLIRVDYDIENLKVGKSEVPIMNCYACEDIVLVKFHQFPYFINGIHPFLVAQNVCKEKPVSTIIKPVVIFPPKPGSTMTQPVCLGHPFKEKLVSMKAKLVGNVTVTRSPSNVVLTEMTLHESLEWCIDINVLPIICEKRNSLALLIYKNIYVHVPMHFNSWDVPSGRTDLESSYLPLQKRMMKQFKESTCFNSIIRIYTFFHDKEPSRRSWSLVPAALPSGEIDLVYVPELLLVGLESPVNPHRCLLKINHFKREVISCSGHFVPGIVVYERPGRVIPFEFTQNMVFVNGKRLSPECSLEHLSQSKRIEVNIEAIRKILKLTSVHIEIFHGYVKLSRGFAMIVNKNQNKRKHSEETSVSSVKGQNEKDGKCNITKKPVESRLSKEPITDTRQVRDSHDNSNNKDDVLCARSSRDHSSLKHNISSERETENLPKKVENISGTLIEMLPGGIAHMIGRISQRKRVNIVLKWENVEGCTSVEVFKELVQKRTALYADIERVKSEVILYHATIAWRTMRKPAGKLFHEILTQSNIAEITAKLLSPLKTVDQLQQNAGTVDKCTGNTVQYSKNCEETQSNDIVDSNKEKKKLSVPFTDSSRDHISSLNSFRSILENTKRSNLPAMAENITGVLVEMVPDGIVYVVGKISKKKFVNVVVRWENLTGCKTVNELKKLVQNRTCLYADVKLIKPELILYHATLAWLEKKPVRKFSQRELTDADITEMTTRILDAMRTNENLEISATQGKTSFNATNNRTKRKKSKDEPRSNEITDKTAQSNSDITKNPVGDEQIIINIDKDINRPSSVDNNTHKQNLNEIKMGSFENLAYVMHNMFSEEGDSKVNEKIKILTEIVDNDAGKYTAANDLVKEDKSERKKSKDEPRANEITDKTAQSNSDMTKTPVGDERIIIFDKEVIRSSSVDNNTHKQNLNEIKMGSFENLASVMQNIFSEETDSKENEKIKILTEIVDNDAGKYTAANDLVKEDKSERKKSKDEPRANEITDKTAQSNSDITKTPVGDERIIIVDKEVIRSSSVDNYTHKQNLNEIKMGSFENLAYEMHNMFSEERDSKVNEKIKILTEIVDNDAGKYTAANDLVKEDKSERKKSKDEPRANEITDKTAQSNSDITKTPVGDERIIIVDKEVIRSSSVDNNTHKQNLNEIKMGSFENLASVMHNIFSEETDSKENEKIKILTEIVDNDAGKYTAANDLVKEDKSERKKSKDEPRANEITDKTAQSNSDITKTPVGDERIIIVDKEVIRSSSVDNNTHKQNLNEIKMGSFENLAYVMHNMFSEERDSKVNEKIKILNEIVIKDTGDCTAANDLVKEDKQEQLNNLFQTSNAIKWITPFREKNNCIDCNKYKKELDEVNTSSFKNQMHNVSSEERDNSKIEGIRTSDDKLTGTMSYSTNKMTRVEGKEQIIENKREVSSIDNNKYKVVFTEYNIELDREISEVHVPSNNHTDNEEFANNNETQELNWIVNTGSDSKSKTTENFFGEEENGETRSLDGIVDNDTDNKSNVTEKSVIEEDSKEGDTEVSNPVDNKKGPNNLTSESYRDLVMSMHNTNCVYSGTGSEKYEDLHTTVDIFDKHTGRVVSNTLKVPVAGEKSEEQILKDCREVNNSKGECKMNEVNTGIENLVSTVHNLSSEERQGETVKDEEQNKDKKEVNELYKESSKGQFLSFNVCEKSYELCSGSSSQPPKANRFQISIDDNMTEAKSATSATENMQLKRKKKTKWSKVEDFFSSETSLKSYKTYEAKVTHFENPKALVATITLADQEFEVFVLNRFFTPARFTRTLCDSEPMASFVALGDRLYVKPKPRLPCNDHYKYEWFAMHAWTEDEDTDLEKSVSEENKQLEDEEEDGVEGILIAIFEQYGVIEDSGCKEKLVFYRENALLFQAPLATVDLNCIFKIGDTIRFSMKNNTVQVWMGKSENITESTIQIFQFCKTNSVDDKTKIALMQALAPQNPQPPQHLESASRLSATSKSRCDSSDVDTVFFETASDGGDLHSDDESLYPSMSSTDVEDDEAGCSHFLRHNRSFQSLSSVTESQLPDSNLYTERGISIDEPRDQDTIQNCSLYSDYGSVKNVLVKSTEIDQDPVNATLALESRNANTQCSVLNADDISAQNGLIQNTAVGQGLAYSLRRVLAPNQINEELLLETLEREMYHMLRRVSSRLMGSTDHVAGWMDTLRNCTTARSSQTISTGNVFTLKHYTGDL